MCQTEITLTCCGDPKEVRTIFCEDKKCSHLKGQYFFQEHPARTKIVPTPASDGPRQRCKNCISRRPLCTKTTLVHPCGHDMVNQMIDPPVNICEVVGCTHQRRSHYLTIPAAAPQSGSRCKDCQAKPTWDVPRQNTRLYKYKKVPGGKGGELLLESILDGVDTCRTNRYRPPPPAPHGGNERFTTMLPGVTPPGYVDPKTVPNVGVKRTPSTFSRASSKIKSGIKGLSRRLTGNAKKLDDEEGGKKRGFPAGSEFSE